MRTGTIRLGIILAGAVIGMGFGAALAGETPVANTAPVAIPSDPFSEVLKGLPTERISAGSSCVILKIPLPEGVRAEDVLPAQ